jgi:putative DNA primase/helicase
MSGEADVLAAFRAAMVAAGMVTHDELLADGDLHRCRVEGDRAGDKNGWYVLHLDDRPAGAYGCWKRRINAKWMLNGDASWTPADRNTVRRQMAERNERRAAAQASAARLAARIWTAASSVESHPYCTKKGIKLPRSCGRSRALNSLR